MRFFPPPRPGREERPAPSSQPTYFSATEHPDDLIEAIAAMDLNSEEPPQQRLRLIALGKKLLFCLAILLTLLSVGIALTILLLHIGVQDVLPFVVHKQLICDGDPPFTAMCALLRTRLNYTLEKSERRKRESNPPLLPKPVFDHLESLKAMSRDIQASAPESPLLRFPRSVPDNPGINILLIEMFENGTLRDALRDPDYPKIWNRYLYPGATPDTKRLYSRKNILSPSTIRADVQRPKEERQLQHQLRVRLMDPHYESVEGEAGREHQQRQGREVDQVLQQLAQDLESPVLAVAARRALNQRVDGELQLIMHSLWEIEDLDAVYQDEPDWVAIKREWKEHLVALISSKRNSYYHSLKPAGEQVGNRTVSISRNHQLLWKIKHEGEVWRELQARIGQAEPVARLPRHYGNEKSNGRRNLHYVEIPLYELNPSLRPPARSKREDQEDSPDSPLSSVLPASSTPPPPLSGSESHWRAFSGFDCTNPAGTEVVQPALQSSCNTAPRQMSEVRTRSYLLLQENNFSTVKAKKCALHRSAVPAMCGTRSHHALAMDDLALQIPELVEAADCLKYHSTQKYHTLAQISEDEFRGADHQLAMNSTNILRYMSTGELWYDDDDVNCQGTKWWSKSKSRYVYEMIEHRQDNLLIEELNLYMDENNQLIDHQTGVALPRHCLPAHGQCETESATWIWQPPSTDESCRLYLAQELTGSESEFLSEGVAMTVFVDSKQLVRLKKKKKVTKCGRTVYETNYHNFFLLSTDEPDQVLDADFFKAREIDPLTINVANYFDVKAAWLANHLQLKIGDALRNAATAICEEELSAKQMDFTRLAAEQGATTGGTTVSLGEGKFATSTGESWVSYHCPPITVMGMDSDRCYDSLPVRPLPKDQRRLEHYEEEMRKDLLEKNLAAESDFVPLDQLEWFLEPHTHRLSTIANEVPCAPVFAPYFKNQVGDWILVSPALRQAAPPRLLDRVHRTDPWTNLSSIFSEIDFANRGPYKTSLMRKMARVQFLQRVRDQSINRGLPPTGLTSFTPEARGRYFRTDWGTAPSTIMGQLHYLKSFFFLFGWWSSFVFGLYGMWVILGKALSVANAICCPVGGRRTLDGLLTVLFPPIMDAISGVGRILRGSVDKVVGDLTEEGKPPASFPGPDGAPPAAPGPRDLQDELNRASLLNQHLEGLLRRLELSSAAADPAAASAEPKSSPASNDPKASLAGSYPTLPAGEETPTPVPAPLVMTNSPRLPPLRSPQATSSQRRPTLTRWNPQRNLEHPPPVYRPPTDHRSSSDDSLPEFANT